jgi:hypothetical protein
MLDGLGAVFHLIGFILNLFDIASNLSSLPIRFRRRGAMIMHLPDLPIPPVMAAGAAMQTRAIGKRS